MINGTWASSSKLEQVSMTVYDNGYGQLKVSFSVSLSNSSISLWELKKRLDTLSILV